jgi:predicted transcriptional regulator
MSEEEIEKIAQLVFEKLMAKQEEMDNIFIENLLNNEIEIEIIEQDEKTTLTHELNRLTKVLNNVEYSEEYEKAMIIANKIKAIKNRLSEI